MNAAVKNIGIKLRKKGRLRFLLLFLLFFCLLPTTLQAAEKGKVTVTIERLTIGEGYLLQPTQVGIVEGDTYADIFVRACEQSGIRYASSGSIAGKTFYLSGIVNGDSGNPAIPKCITQLPAVYGMKPPNGSESNQKSPDLVEFSYTSMAGWMYTVNHKWPSAGMSDTTAVPSDGDVLRIQFSIFGYGADIGAATETGGLQTADKTALIRLVAQIRKEEAVWFALAGCEETYHQAMQILEQLDSTQEVVDKTYEKLSQYRMIYPESIYLNKKKLALDTTSAPVSVKVSFLPADTNQTDVTYTSSNSSVFTVSSDGMVTPVAAGKAVLTVTGANNKTASCNVTVREKAEPTKDNSDIGAIVNSLKAVILAADTNPGLDSQWNVIGLYRSGLKIDETYRKTFYANAVSALEEKKGALTSTKYTEYSKLILSMTAIGKNAADVNGYNLLEKLSDFDQVQKQGLNGPIWALIAVDANPAYDFPKKNVRNQTSRDTIITYIEKQELKDGGFALSGTEADVDITAMAVQALAPYYETRSDVKQVVDRAITVLSQLQQSDGGYQEGGIKNAESAAQVLTALSAMKINPQSDSRFLKNGNTVFDALLSYYIEGQGFSHTAGGGANAMATEQGFYALVAYQRYLTGKTFLYQMSDIDLNDSPLPETADDPDSEEADTQNTESGNTVSTKSVAAAQRGNLPQQEENETERTILPADKLIAIQGKNRNYSIRGTTEKGSAYTWIFHGTDIANPMDFDITVSEESEYDTVIRQLAPEPYVLHIVQQEFPGEALLQIAVTLEDGTYGLFLFDPDTQTAEFIQRVTVKDGQTKFILSKGGYYYIADRSKGELISEQEAETQETVSEMITGTERAAEDTGSGKREFPKEKLLFAIIGIAAVAVLFPLRAKGRQEEKRNEK